MGSITHSVTWAWSVNGARTSRTFTYTSDTVTRVTRIDLNNIPEDDTFNLGSMPNTLIIACNGAANILVTDKANDAPVFAGTNPATTVIHSNATNNVGIDAALDPPNVDIEGIAVIMKTVHASGPNTGGVTILAVWEAAS